MMTHNAKHPLPTIEAVLESNSASFWLKKALREAVNRDPVDAARDAALLHHLLEQRCDDILSRSS